MLSEERGLLSEKRLLRQESGVLLKKVGGRGLLHVLLGGGVGRLLLELQEVGDGVGLVQLLLGLLHALGREERLRAWAHAVAEAHLRCKARTGGSM
jgi:hypothetical protein